MYNKSLKGELGLKRILIAVGDIYPIPSANGICVKIIAEELIKRGYDVHCIANGYDRCGTVKEVDGVTIHFIKTPFLWKLKESAMNETRYPLKLFCKAVWKTLVYLRLPLYLMAFPAESKMHRNRFTQAISKILKEYNVSAVVGVNKPIEAIWGTYLAAKKNNVPMISYFLDPLAGGIENHIVGKQKSLKRAVSVEKAILDYSTKAIFMEENKSNLFRRFGHDYDNKISFLGAPLLKDNFAKRHNQSIVGKKTILYAGAVGKEMRNPRYIMECFNYIKNARLIMYISNDCKWIEEFCNTNTEIRGRIPHDKMMEKMKSADALLNIGNSDPLFAPSKIIEYVGFGKPIISTYRIAEDTSIQYLDNYPASLCIDERTVSVENAAGEIEKFIEESRTFDFKDIEHFFWKNKPAAFVDVIDSVLMVE